LGPRGAYAGDDDLAESEPVDRLAHTLEVVRVVVLAMNEQNFLVTARDIQIARLHDPQIPGAQPPVAGEGLAIACGIFEIAGGDVLAADLDVADHALRAGRVARIGDAQLAIRDGAPDARQAQRLARRRRQHLHALAHAEV